MGNRKSLGNQEMELNKKSRNQKIEEKDKWKFWIQRHFHVKSTPWNRDEQWYNWLLVIKDTLTLMSRNMQKPFENKTKSCTKVHQFLTFWTNWEIYMQDFNKVFKRKGSVTAKKFHNMYCKMFNNQNYDPQWCTKNHFQRLIEFSANMRKCGIAIFLTLMLLQSLFFVCCENLSDTVYRQLRSVIPKFYFAEASLMYGPCFIQTICMERGEA